MASRTTWVPAILTAAIIAASAATLLLRVSPGAVGCPGAIETGGLIDCKAVIGSAGGHILGLPLGFWALVWLGAFWAQRLWLDGRTATLVVTAGFLGVAYAVGTEIHVGHLCVWCTMDQVSIILLGLWTIVGHRRPRNGRWTPAR